MASSSLVNKLAVIIITASCFLMTNQLDYPKNKDITKGPQYEQQRSVDIETKSELESYITNYDYVIAVFHMDWCGHCRRFLPILDTASTYHIAKRFQFLKINCNLNEICNVFKVDRFPTIKVYNRGNELKIEPIRELEPLLEFIDKLTSNPMIEVDKKLQFYEDYGTYSPIAIYNSNNSAFISCINMLAKSDFLNTFYIGELKTNDVNTKEHLVFDFNGHPISLNWNDNCDDMKAFLNENKFPVMQIINSNVIKKIQRNGKIASLLFIDANDKSQMNFVNKAYTKISYDHRKEVFGYVDMNTESGLASHLKIDFKQKPRLLIYDFSNHRYYIEPKEFEMDKSEEAYNEIERIANDIRRLKYTTGNALDDFLLKFGINRNSNMLVYILIGVLVGIIILMVGIILLCDRPTAEVTPEMAKKKEQ